MLFFVFTSAYAQLATISNEVKLRPTNLNVKIFPVDNIPLIAYGNVRSSATPFQLNGQSTVQQSNQATPQAQYSGATTGSQLPLSSLTNARAIQQNLEFMRNDIWRATNTFLVKTLSENPGYAAWFGRYVVGMTSNWNLWVRYHIGTATNASDMLQKLTKFWTDYKSQLFSLSVYITVNASTQRSVFLDALNRIQLSAFVGDLKTVRFVGGKVDGLSALNSQKFRPISAAVEGFPATFNNWVDQWIVSPGMTQ